MDERDLAVNALHEAGHALSAWVHGETIISVELWRDSQDGAPGGRVRIDGDRCLVTELSGMAAQCRAIAERADPPPPWSALLWHRTVPLLEARYASCTWHDVRFLPPKDAATREPALCAAGWLIGQADIWLAAHVLKDALVSGRDSLTGGEVAELVAPHVPEHRRIDALHQIRCIQGQ